jgi:DNA-binding transcriptional LysR family regulator
MARKSQPVRRLDFDELSAAEVFLHVVRSNSFTAAAKTLGKSTSSLSRTVAELERQLGAQLLARTTRRLHLTEAGALYAQRAGRDAVAELTGGIPRGHLRVTMPVTVGERLLGPAVPELRRRFPELKLELDLSDRNVALVQGGYDLAIRVGRLADSSLRAQLLGKVALRLVASPRYLAKHGHPKQPADLAKHACISVGPLAGTHEWAFHRRVARPRHLPVEGVVHTTSPALAAQLAVSGIGLVRIVDWIIREELRRGELVEVMPEWTCDDPALGGVPVYAVFSQTAGMPVPLKTRVFIDAVKDLIEMDSFVRKR